ncbi:hypothetical protein ACU6ZT_16320 [Klebsiella aerogenes]
MENLYNKREHYESLLIALQDVELHSLDEDTLLSIKAAVDDYKSFKRYNQLAYFTPYEYQSKFFMAGSEYNYRMLCCGNQMGKVMVLLSNTPST